MPGDTKFGRSLTADLDPELAFAKELLQQLTLIFMGKTSANTAEHLAVYALDLRYTERNFAYENHRFQTETYSRKQSILIKIEQMGHLKCVEYIAILALVLKSPLQISSRRQN